MANDKTRNGGRWTEARFRGFIVSSLRSATRRWPPKYERLKEYFVGVKRNPKSGRDAKHYRCAACEGEFPQSGVQVDHIEPVGEFKGWDVFIERLFCEADNLQVLCKPCHKAKTKKEATSKSVKQSKPKKAQSSSKENSTNKK